MVKKMIKRIMSIILVSSCLLIPLWVTHSGVFDEFNINVPNTLKEGKAVYKTHKDWHIQKIDKEEVYSIEVYDGKSGMRRTFSASGEEGQIVADIINAFTNVTIAQEVSPTEIEGTRYELTFEFDLQAKRTVNFVGNYYQNIIVQPLQFETYEVNGSDLLYNLIVDALEKSYAEDAEKLKEQVYTSAGLHTYDGSPEGVHPADFCQFICLYDYGDMQIPIDDNYLEGHNSFEGMKAGIDQLMKENITADSMKKLLESGSPIEGVADAIFSIPDILKYLEASEFEVTGTEFEIVENDGVNWGFSKPAKTTFSDRSGDPGAIAQLINFFMKGDTDRQGYQELGGYKSIDTLNVFQIGDFWYYCDIVDYWLMKKAGNENYSPFVYITFAFPDNETDYYEFWRNCVYQDENSIEMVNHADNVVVKWCDYFERVHCDAADFAVGGAYFKEGAKYPLGLSLEEHYPVWYFFPSQFEKAAHTWEDETYMAAELIQITGNIPTFFEMPDESTWPTYRDWEANLKGARLAS